MKLTIALALSLAFATVAGPALADDADKAACADKAEGDDCTRGDGDPGVCVPDDSDPVLTCEDDAGSSGRGSGSGDSSADSSDDDTSTGDGCSAGGAPGSGLGALLLAGLALAARRRS
jgi:MYXO-CTERM domain-containing protein